MNLQEILEQNDLVMSINNNFNVLSFYIPEIECMVEFNQKQPQHLLRHMVFLHKINLMLKVCLEVLKTNLYILYILYI